MKKAPLLKKLLMSLLTVVVAMVLTFILVRMMPGDPIYTRAREIQLEQNLPSFEMAMDIARSQYNFDPTVPLHRQFIHYVKGLLSGNLGESIFFVFRLPPLLRKPCPGPFLLLPSPFLPALPLVV
jgi:peptide/nickel transport system permease protein